MRKLDVLRFFRKQSWHVKPEGHPELDLMFSTRRQARMQKRLFKESHRKLDSVIVHHELFDNYMVDTEVS